ncbi:predicted protein [Pyrenophora tritici-repentis Pt-1C-BFP]|uniref:Uncharacterized protein n=1 Tax=Pyrenophora tritici-repentis (strain Pt-1C-BFP) TaxID=426418 RepID=B2W1E7_PYRTR|nr:uncharacterized protein PTRG_04282 [Pyrenophora tritici-repentis Pt-1C-BFP]EDU47120.1 predicted protein [Pyrenophora tritici-repentis Pt-1C-BFP]
MSATNNNNNTDTGTVSLPTLPGQGRQGQAGLPQAPPPLPFDRFIGEWRAWERGLSAEEWHAFYYSLPTREWQGEFPASQALRVGLPTSGGAFPLAVRWRTSNTTLLLLSLFPARIDLKMSMQAIEYYTRKIALHRSSKTV